MKKRLVLIALTLGMFSIPLLSNAEGIQWQSYKDGMKKGKSENKKIFLNFHADWWTFCKKMEAESFSDPEIIQFLNSHFILIRTNIDKEKKIASTRSGLNWGPKAGWLFRVAVWSNTLGIAIVKWAAYNA